MQKKEVAAEPTAGLLTAFSPGWACIAVKDEIEIAREVRMDIMDPLTAKPVSIYARVASFKRESNGIAHWMKISYAPPELGKTLFDDWTGEDNR